MKTYKPSKRALRFVLHRKSTFRKNPVFYASVTKEDAARAGRPEFFYVLPGVPNTTDCGCFLSYPIVIASLPPLWQQLGRQALRVDGMKTYFTCNCQGRIDTSVPTACVSQKTA